MIHDDLIAAGITLTPEQRKARREAQDATLGQVKLWHKERRSTPEAIARRNTQAKARRKTRDKEWRRMRVKSDLNFKLSCALRSRVHHAIRGNFKAGSAIRDLGCSIEAFKLYIEKQFKPGMTWENWGHRGEVWHLDHKIPLAYFDLIDRVQFLRACHFTNYQPLWALDNLRKHNRFIPELAVTVTLDASPFSI